MLDLISQSSVKTHPRAASAGGRSEATNMLQVVRRTFHWALAHDLSTTDQTIGVVASARSQARSSQSLP